MHVSVSMTVHLCTHIHIYMNAHLDWQYFHSARHFAVALLFSLSTPIYMHRYIHAYILQELQHGGRQTHVHTEIDSAHACTRTKTTRTNTALNTHAHTHTHTQHAGNRLRLRFSRHSNLCLHATSARPRARATSRCLRHSGSSRRCFLPKSLRASGGEQALSCRRSRPRV
jgi:hypothetical protein